MGSHWHAVVQLGLHLVQDDQLGLGQLAFFAAGLGAAGGLVAALLDGVEVFEAELGVDHFLVAGGGPPNPRRG